MKDIAIVIIAYSREDSLSRLLNSLGNAYYPHDTKVNLIISIDKSDKIEVCELADDYQWHHGEKLIVKHEKNIGLRTHILSCGQYLQKYDAIIVLEDDLIVSPNFYNYALATVSKYYNDISIAGISLYSFAVNYQTGYKFHPIKNGFDAYFMNCAQSWGQIWMKNQWNLFLDWYNANQEDFDVLPHLPVFLCKWPKSSWLKYHTRYCIEQNKYFVYPYVALSTNNSDLGENNRKSTNHFQVILQEEIKKSYSLPSSVDESICYDGFFENKKLAKILSLKDLCIDLNGEKENRESNQYWLTLRSLNYQVLKQYGLKLKPIESNIIYNVPGSDIFLYNTHIKSKAPSIDNTKLVLYRYEVLNAVRFIKEYGIKQFLKDVYLKIAERYFS